MDQMEYWEKGHAIALANNLEEAQAIFDALEKTQAAHEKGGVFFNTTKRLLEVYRSLRFDAVHEKILKTAESIDGYSADLNSAAMLDNILAMPEIYAYYSREIKHFTETSIPVTMGLFVHAVDAGLKMLAFTERDKVNDLKYADILKALYVDEQKDPHTLVDQFHTTWATFYRKKNEAITALSIIIFGPLGNRHPSSVFNDNSLQKKYGRFMEWSDKIDLICGLAEVTEKYERK